MKENKPYPAIVRPLPYYNIKSGANEQQLAAALRREFLPKVKRLLPGHHLGAFRHDFIINFIKRHKQAYPCYVRTDIKQFYPSIRHQDVVVGCQVAYRDLLNMKYVPANFKKKYVGPVNAWCKTLPLHKGIPIGSALSSILAPVMLLPLWLQIKRRFGVPFLVYMDDILLCTVSQEQSCEIYAYIDNYLRANYALELNTAKTTSGRFSRNCVDFCGWRFAGGYTSISEEKLSGFRERIHLFITRYKNPDIRTFIKRLNYKITGFGHYYKYGHVANQFRALDMFIRNAVRRHISRFSGLRIQQLASLGFRSLSAIYASTRRTTGQQPPAARPGSLLLTTKPVLASSSPDDTQVRIADALDKIQAQLTQLLSLHRKQVRTTGEVLNALWSAG